MKYSQLRDLVTNAIEKKEVSTVLDCKQVLIANEEALSAEKNYPKLLALVDDFLIENKAKVPKNQGVVAYDFGKYELIKTPWDTLWDKSTYKDFPTFLLNYLLPVFHKCPDMDVQHPIMACFALFNSAALPDKVKKPNSLCCGQSRTGKSQFASLCMKMVKHKFTRNIKGNFSPLAVTQNVHNACYISGDDVTDLITAPSVVRFDNVYIKEFISRLADHYVTLLALEKADSICKIGGKDGGTYFPWSKYVFTTVDVPYRDNDKMSELLNRTLVFYFGKGFDPELDSDNYSWKSVEDEFSNLWNKEDVEKVFFPLLVDTGKVDKRNLKMEPTEYDISRVLIATGLYSGIFYTVKEGIQAFELYWHYVRERQSNVGNLMYKLVDEYLQKSYFPEVSALMQLKSVSRKTAIKSTIISLQDVSEYISRVSNGVVSVRSEKKLEELEGLLSQHDLITKTIKGSVYFVHRSSE